MNYTLKLMISFVLISVVLIMGCVEQGVFFPTKEVVYDKEILEEFNKSEWIPALVRLKDESGIKIEGTKEQRVALLKQRDEWFKPVIDEVLNKIPASAIKDVRKRSNGFSGYITKQGFEILLTDPHVKEIIRLSGKDVHTTDPVEELSINKTTMEDVLLNQTEDMTLKSKIDPKIIEAFKTQEWINVIVVLKDNSDVNISSGVTNAEKITLSLKKDKQNLIVQSEVIASLSESEFKVKSKSLAGRGFSGEISKKGLIKLENDPRVSEIRKPIEGGLATNE